MAGLAPEESQFDARQFDTKMNELLSSDGQDFFTSYDEVHDCFDMMGLQENLLRGIYAYGLEKPSAIQQRRIVRFCKGLDVTQLAQSETGKTATFCSGSEKPLALQQSEMNLVDDTQQVESETEKSREWWPEVQHAKQWNRRKLKVGRREMAGERARGRERDRKRVENRRK